MGVVMGEGTMGCSSVVHASVNVSVMCIAVRGHALRCCAHDHDAYGRCGEPRSVGTEGVG